MKTTDPRERVLAMIGEQLDRRVVEVRKRQQRMVDALAAYEQAVESDRAAELAQRLGMSAPPPAARQASADRLLSEIMALPELAPHARRHAPAPEVAVPKPAAPAEPTFPCTRLRQRSGALLVVGGDDVRERRDITTPLGLASVDWVVVNDARSLARITTRIGLQRYAAVVVFWNRLDPEYATQIRGACAQHHVPLADSPRAGGDALRTSILAIEHSLQTEAKVSP